MGISCAINIAIRWIVSGNMFPSLSCKSSHDVSLKGGKGIFHPRGVSRRVGKGFPTHGSVSHLTGCEKGFPTHGLYQEVV